jgi:hypothetical protein
VDWIHLAQDRNKQAIVNMIVKLACQVSIRSVESVRLVKVLTLVYVERAVFRYVMLCTAAEAHHCCGDMCSLHLEDQKVGQASNQGEAGST